MVIRKKRKGFTLLELLVVVAIIVVLIAILVPALDKALASAHKASCLVNVKAFSSGYRLYSTDFKGNVIGIDPNSAPRKYWNYALAPYMGYTGYASAPVVGAQKFMLCPETTVNTAGGFAPTARTTWNWDTGQGSYSFNLFFMNYLQYNPNLGYDAKWWYQKFDTANGGAPIIGDGTWIGGWPTESDPDSSSYDPPVADSGAAYTQMWRWLVNRHGGNTVNMSFVDGSARNIILGELWQLPWHRYYESPGYKAGGWDTKKD